MDGRRRVKLNPSLICRRRRCALSPLVTIDMDFMNLNQSAHGDREFGHLAMRIGLKRKVVAGYWGDQDVQERLASWSRAAAGWHDSQHMKVARFGDNMRDVAVTEGDKVEA